MFVVLSHCSASLFSLYFGGNRLNSVEEGTRTVEVDGEAAFVHPEYNPSNLNNDIALIRLPEPLELSGERTGNFYLNKSSCLFS